MTQKRGAFGKKCSITCSIHLKKLTMSFNCESKIQIEGVVYSVQLCFGTKEHVKLISVSR